MKEGERKLLPQEIIENRFYVFADEQETVIRVLKVFSIDEVKKAVTTEEEFKTQAVLISFVSGNRSHPLFNGINMQTGKDEFKNSCYMTFKAFCNSVKVKILN